MKLNNIRATAKRFDCSPWTVRRAIIRGEIAAVRIGRRWKVTEQEIKRVLARGTAKQEGR
jgi:excisionase family DNA binding protein